MAKIDASALHDFVDRGRKAQAAVDKLTKPQWVENDPATEADWLIRGKECFVWMQRRPNHCDRGRWLAHVEATGKLARDMDRQDGWPRYYFDLERAKLEVEAWLRKRGQI